MRCGECRKRHGKRTGHPHLQSERYGNDKKKKAKIKILAPSLGAQFGAATLLRIEPPSEVLRTPSF